MNDLEIELEVADVAKLKNRIKELREARGWNHSQLAQRMGVAHTTVIRLEEGGPNGMKLTAEYLNKFAEVFNVHPAVIITDADIVETDAEAEALQVLRKLSQERREAAVDLLRRLTEE